MSSDIDFLEGLLYLEEIDFPTYYSPGAYERALELAEIAKNSVHYLDEFFENKVQNTLLVLSEEDWTKQMESPYGFAAGINNYLWYPAVKEDNPVFIELVPYYENSPEDLRQEHAKLLSNCDSPYFYSLLKWWEVVMVHEYVHNYNRENGVTINLKWFEELLCHYFTYAFLKRYEKEKPTDVHLFELTVKIMYLGGIEIVEHKTIEDFEALYYHVGAANFIWYHTWFNLGVIDLYKMYGERFIEKVISLYQSESGFDSSSEKLAARLDKELDGYQDWFEEWVQQKSDS